MDTLQSALRREDLDAVITLTLPTIQKAVRPLYSYDSAADLEDMTQAATLAVIKVWPRFERPICPDRWRAYTYQTARKAALKSVWKHSSRESPLSLDIPLWSDPERDTAPAYDILDSGVDIFEEVCTKMMRDEIIHSEYLTGNQRTRMIQHLLGISTNGADLRPAKDKLANKWHGIKVSRKRRDRLAICRNGKHEMTPENSTPEAGGFRCRQCRLDRRRKI